LKEKFEAVICSLIMNNKGETLSELDVSEQFCPDRTDDISVAGNLNAAFLIFLSGERHPLYRDAENYLIEMQGSSKWAGSAAFYLRGRDILIDEINRMSCEDKKFRFKLDDMSLWAAEKDIHCDTGCGREKARNLFFPEGDFSAEEKDEKIKDLRNSRRIRIQQLNTDPVKFPEREILITSNVLLTVPHSDLDSDEGDANEKIIETAKKASAEKQIFWYDHPIPFGIAANANEIIYGLKKLDESLAFEEENGTKDPERKMDCVLSASVTHEGLHPVAREYIENEIKKACSIKRLNIFVFTEEDSKNILNRVLIPAAEKYFPGRDTSELKNVFGVDGEYGRHYSFLKAVSAFWKVFISPEIKGTFKIDLDQVFPQDVLVRETGLSAFGHLCSPLWGASGEDTFGNRVRLGMIAGTLVNEKDIKSSLYTPDVTFPPDDAAEDSIIFYSRKPQALSTEAEMMTRYGKDSGIDGTEECIQRIHVTGGTNGILVSDLRKYRPFTPSFISRAEDQAYLLSVLFRKVDREYLRYCHRDGLIMRHDKEAFAGEAIKAARIGSMLGDYIRILMFSFYADALDWDVSDIKEYIDPFTGCFVSEIPFTAVYLRFALRTAAFFNSGSEDDEAYRFMTLGTERLSSAVDMLYCEKNPLLKIYKNEKAGWDLYYDILDVIEEKILNSDADALKLKSAALQIADVCRINSNADSGPQTS